ncbi:DsbA family protein [Lacisediminihabitans sp.]|uniref:DsbA family protein n=1 Tax=Lacisediminihabitans sp. TaxID=2787631 RepID=UPI00374DA5EC
MSYGGAGDDRLSKNQRREAAREKARTLREEQRKKDRRSRFVLQGSLIVVSLAIIAVIVVVITSSVRPPSAGPKNMLSDGIKIGQNLAAVPTAALEPGDAPVPSPRNKADVIDIQIFVDYQCPVCQVFEQTNTAQIESYLKTGAATLEIHPIAILDNRSLGQRYSSRAANAAACVANFSPNSYFNFNGLLFEEQPKENTEGLTDQKLISIAKQAKVESLASITSCITDQSFKAWVTAATSRATTGPIPNSDVKKVSATPTVIINGAKFNGAATDASAFSAAIQKAAGDTFREGATATPSPSPAP